MSPIRTLIVDDDFAVARLHGSFLKPLPGFELVGSELSASGALKRFKSGDVDLILLDLYLPDASGIDLIRRMRADASLGVDFDVIMVSAAHEPALVEQAVRLGVADFLLKPFTGEVFQSRLRSYASSRRAKQRMQELPGLTQSQIDSFFAAGVGSGRASTGMSSATRGKVLDELAWRTGAVTARELAEDMGLSRVSVRRYLERLAHEGIIEMQPRYGEAGRPQHEYWLDR